MKISSAIETTIIGKKEKKSAIYVCIAIGGNVFWEQGISIHITKKISAVTLKYEPCTISWDAKTNQNLEKLAVFVKGLNKAKHLAEILDKKYI